jgi:hypothetical protein
MSTVTHEVLLALRDLFATRFSGDELEDLAFRLGVDLEDIPGSTRSAKAREFAQYLNRRGLMDKLKQVGPEVRKELPWGEIFGNAAGPAPVAVAVDGAELAAAAQVVAGLPDFAAPVDRRAMLIAAGLSAFAAGIDLIGPERSVSLRVMTTLSEVSTAADGQTPLGKFLRYVLTIPEAFHHKELLEGLIAKYQL